MSVCVYIYTLCIYLFFFSTLRRPQPAALHRRFADSQPITPCLHRPPSSGYSPPWLRSSTIIDLQPQLWVWSDAIDGKSICSGEALRLGDEARFIYKARVNDQVRAEVLLKGIRVSSLCKVRSSEFSPRFDF